MDPKPLPPAPFPSSKTTETKAAICTNCKSDDRWVLHPVYHNKSFKRLCASCVLKLHPTLFCPSCFALHKSKNSDSKSKTLTCFKCSSISHLSCVPVNAPKSPYLCPPCSSHSLKFPILKKPIPQCDTPTLKSNLQLIDLRVAKILFAVGTIAKESMDEAMLISNVEMKKSVMGSELARRSCKEKIDECIKRTDGYEKPECWCNGDDHKDVISELNNLSVEQ